MRRKNVTVIIMQRKVRNENHIRYEIFPRVLSQDSDTTKALLQSVENRVSLTPHSIELFEVDIQLEIIVYPS